MDFTQAVNFLYSLVNYERRRANYNDLKLERFKNFLSDIGNPENRLKKPILIAGTKGKGSTATLLANCLKECKLRVGLYTSPHLLTLRERIQIQGEKIGKDEIARITREIKPYIKKHQLTFFEALTGIAFLFFTEKDLDYTVVEVGLGGRLDATNVISPLVSVITRIDYDHTEILGKTLAKIAFEKAGIMRENIPLVTFHQRRSVDKVFRTVAQKKNSEILYAEDFFKITPTALNSEGTFFRVQFKKPAFGLSPMKENLVTNLLGFHQLENIGIGLTVLRQLAISDMRINFSDIKRGLKSVPIIGRCTILNLTDKNKKLSLPNKIILDTAHNPCSANALKDALLRLFSNPKKFTFLFGVAKDKDAFKMLSLLKPAIQKIIFTEAKTPRAMPLEKLTSIGRKLNLNFESARNIKEAFLLANEYAQKNSNILCVTGSFYLTGEVLKILNLKEE